MSAFIVLEGGDKTGKTTQFELLKLRLPECVYLSNTKATALGQLMRDHYLHASMSPETSVRLALAVAHDECEQIIVPALSLGQTVIADRWFYSALVYNGIDRSRWGSWLSLLPSHPFTIYLSERQAPLHADDRFENEETAAVVASRYEEMAADLGFTRIGGGTIAQMHERIVAAVRGRETFCRS